MSNDVRANRCARFAPILAFVGVLVSGEAGATTGLAWQWSEPVRYHIITRVNVPTLLTLSAEQNKEVRIAEFQLDLVTTCSPVAPLGKTAWEVRCNLDDVALQATAIRANDEERLVPILEEFDAKYSAGAWVQLGFGANGRIKTIDLEGVDKNDRRVAAIQETMRLIVGRAFASLDLEMPAKGDDKGKGTWKSDDMMATRLPSAQGSMGQVVVEHTIAPSEGAIVTITSTGHGVIGSGEMVPSANGSSERPANNWDLKYEGMARFDTARGLLLEREYLVDGVATSSSQSADGLAGLPYVQAARAVLITAADKPVLPATGQLPPR